MKVLQQISVELARRPAIARQSPCLKPIFVPGLSKFQPNSLNQLPGVLRQIEKAITTHFQDNVLMKLLAHCDRLDQIIGERRDAELCRLESRRVLVNSCTMIPAVLMIACMAFVTFDLVDRDTIVGYGLTGRRMDPIVHLWDQLHDLPYQYDLPILGTAFSLIAVFGIFAARSPRPSSVFEREVDQALKKLRDVAGRVETIRKDARKLYEEFLLTTVDDL
ncbi:hypothetical protein BIW11_10134 [Tropilaelaps mercedesae]|uniref:Uncharacterized protein n=1 Tax=Tropilaelaps mercedesae TaxID=418985 RepID=A0A1V9XHB3_9ACAR|nr:hypothetical protein BIW11_10134 [Tropilaelaps mercedesae]